MKIHYVTHQDLSKQEIAGSAGSLNRIRKLTELKDLMIIFSPTKKSDIESIENASFVYIPMLKICYINRIIFQILLSLKMFIYYFSQNNHPDCLVIRHHPLNFGFILPALVFKIPFFLEVHADIVEELRLDRRSYIIPEWYFIFFRNYEKWIFKRSNGIILNHIALKRFFAKEYAIPNEKLEVIPNGSDIDFFKPIAKDDARKALNLDQNRKRLLFIGHISKWHGVDYIINFVPFLRDLRTDFIIDIVGKEGEYGSGLRLKEMADEICSREYINFVGPVTREQARLWIASADLCLLPVKMVRKHPGSPVKLFDYIAMGKPVAAANVESYGDFIEENQLGISVDYENPPQTASKIHNLLNTDLSFYNIHNRYLAETKFSWYQRAILIHDFINGRIESDR